MAVLMLVLKCNEQLFSQLAITLRTAMTVKKKDSHKTVYNWQFVHSLLLWCHLLATIRIAAMQPLIYPVVQVSFANNIAEFV